MNLLQKQRISFKLDLHAYSEQYDMLLAQRPIDAIAIARTMELLDKVTQKYIAQDMLKEYKEDIEEYERNK